jgi:hypothetical protein
MPVDIHPEAEPVHAVARVSDLAARAMDPVAVHLGPAVVSQGLVTAADPDLQMRVVRLRQRVAARLVLVVPAPVDRVVAPVVPALGLADRAVVPRLQVVTK